MQLFTIVPFQKPAVNFSHNDQFFSIGSCFSQNIHEKLITSGFNSINNPFGTVFHPEAILHQLQFILKKKSYTQENLYHHNGIFHALDFSFPFHHERKDVLMDKISTIIQSTFEYLNETTVVIITLGTSWKYHLSEQNIMVSNCHKLPQKLFKKILSTPEEMAATLHTIDDLLWNNLPNLKSVIYTISPVRHTKDGFFENQTSKGVLFYGMFKLKNSDTKSLYFPVYEWFMDELRDYRFYAEDLVHPNNTSIHWIWEKFIENFFDDTTKSQVFVNEKIEKSNQHRSLSIFNDD